METSTGENNSPEADQELVSVGVDVDENATLLDADDEIREKKLEDQAPGSMAVPNFEYPGKYRKNTMSGCIPGLPCVKRTIGRLNVLSSAPNGEPLVVFGPCWPCLSITYTLVITISASLFAAILPHCHYAMTGISIFLLTWVLVALSRTACSNPGIIPRCTEPPADNWVWHSGAESYYEPGKRAHYCSEAQVLVYGHDHFCPWTGTVIAGNNLRHFHTFLCGLVTILGWIFFLVIFGQQQSFGGDGAMGRHGRN